MLKEFKNFISQRNTVDMCVGIIIGSALTTLSKSLTNNLINPLLGLILGKIDFAKLSFTIGHTPFRVGSFVNSLISFIIIALIVFFIIKIFDKFTDYKKSNPNEKVEELLTESIHLQKEQLKINQNQKH